MLRAATVDVTARRYAPRSESGRISVFAYLYDAHGMLQSYCYCAPLRDNTADLLDLSYPVFLPFHDPRFHLPTQSCRLSSRLFYSTSSRVCYSDVRGSASTIEVRKREHPHHNRPSLRQLSKAISSRYSAPDQVQSHKRSLSSESAHQAASASAPHLCCLAYCSTHQ